MLKLLKFFLFGFVVPIHFSVDAKPLEVEKSAAECNQTIIEIAKEIELFFSEKTELTPLPEKISKLFSAQNSWNNFDAEKLIYHPNLIKTFIKFFRWGNQDLKYVHYSKILAYFLQKFHTHTWATEKIKFQVFFFCWEK